MNDVVRNPDGTFPKGVSGNPAGRPSKKNQLTELKQDLEIAVRENVKPHQIHDIVQAMVQKALEGNVGAAKLILDKTVSNAKESEDVTVADSGIRIVIENATIAATREEAEERPIIDITPTEEQE